VTKREQHLRAALAEVLESETHEVSVTTPFADLGVDSLVGLRFSRKIQDLVNAEIELEWLFDYPTIRQLSQFLDGRFGGSEQGGTSLN
jgi:polyketide synthase PksN